MFMYQLKCLNEQDIFKPESGITNELYVNLNNGSGAVLPENQATSNDTPSAPADSDKYASNIMYEITFKSDRKEEITGLIYRNIKYYFYQFRTSSDCVPL